MRLPKVAIKAIIKKSTKVTIRETIRNTIMGGAMKMVDTKGIIKEETITCIGKVSDARAIHLHRIELG